LFHKIVASAGTDAGVDAFITERLGGAPDHPMTVTFPEGEYLKGLVLVRKL
jgi:23S rRNA (cytosine1962-C5)-methyltransferase